MKAVFLAALLVPTVAIAAPACRDARGHFIRCPQRAATVAPAHRCRQNGRFAACPAPATAHH